MQDHFKSHDEFIANRERYVAQAHREAEEKRKASLASSGSGGKPGVFDFFAQQNSSSATGNSGGAAGGEGVSVRGRSMDPPPGTSVSAGAMPSSDYVAPQFIAPMGAGNGEGAPAAEESAHSWDADHHIALAEVYRKVSAPVSLAQRT